VFEKVDKGEKIPRLDQYDVSLTKLVREVHQTYHNSLHIIKIPQYIFLTKHIMHAVVTSTKYNIQ